MQNLDRVITKIGQELKKKNLTIVTAESCSGGGLAYLITGNETCSPYLERGYITYSNQSKEQLLQVKAESIQLHGAVSKQVAIEMSAGALKNSGAQISIGITGISGSDQNKKSLGIVWISFDSVLGKNKVFKKEIKGNREKFVKEVLKFTILAFERFLNDIF